MAKFHKSNGRKPMVSGDGGVWVTDGYSIEAKQRIYMIEFRGDDGKCYSLEVTERDSHDIIKALTSYHAHAYRVSNPPKKGEFE